MEINSAVATWKSRPGTETNCRGRKGHEMGGRDGVSTCSRFHLRFSAVRLKEFALASANSSWISSVSHTGSRLMHNCINTLVFDKLGLKEFHQ